VKEVGEPVNALNQDPVLLVGGMGFIGRALAARLSADGREVHVLGRRPASGLPAGVVVHCGDQGDRDLVRPLRERCSAVVHLAGATVPADTAWQPVAEVEASLLPALRFLECAQEFPEHRYLLLSTGGALYGDCGLARETSPLRPTSYHGAGKLSLEAFFGVLGRRHACCLSILRPANAYGPGQPLRAGFGVIRTLLERARDCGRVTVYGDGRVVRHYLYIDDMVDACLAALARPAITCNIGSGRGISLRELIAVIEGVTEKSLSIDLQSARPSDVGHIVLDVTQAKEALGWSASIALEEGVRRMWQSLQ
jgi:UDP-glucose 4-epimerase